MKSELISTSRMTSHLRRRRKYDEKTSGHLSDPAKGDPPPRIYSFAYLDPVSITSAKCAIMLAVWACPLGCHRMLISIDELCQAVTACADWSSAQELLLRLLA